MEVIAGQIRKSTKDSFVTQVLNTQMVNNYVFKWWWYNGLFSISKIYQITPENRNGRRLQFRLAPDD